MDVSKEELEQARVIAARNLFWTPEIEKLLRRWQKQISLRRSGHKSKEKKYNIMYYTLGIPSAILATTVSTGILSSFQGCDSKSKTCIVNERIRIATGVLSVCSVITSVLMTFIDAGSLREKHKNSCDMYDELLRKIDIILRLPINARGDPINVLQDFRSKFDDIVRNSPPIPSEYETSLEYKKANSNYTLKPPTIQDVDEKDTNSSSFDTSKLANLLIGDIEEGKNIEKEVENANQNIANEDKEVMIKFDLDSIRSEDILEERRKKLVLDSLSKALEFELGRLSNDFPERRTSKMRKKKSLARKQFYTIRSEMKKRNEDAIVEKNEQ